jgi:hypothetical protein
MSQYFKLSRWLLPSTPIPILYSLSSIICWSAVKVTGRVVKLTNNTYVWGMSGPMYIWINRLQWGRMLQIVCTLCSRTLERKLILQTVVALTDTRIWERLLRLCVVVSWRILRIVYGRTKELRVTGWTAHWNVLIGSQLVTFEYERV